MPATSQTKQRKSTAAELAAHEAAGSALDPFADANDADDAVRPTGVEIDERFDLDLDAVLPAEVEAVTTTTRIRVEGRVIELPLMQFWPLRAAHLAEHDGDLLGAFSAALVANGLPVDDTVEFLADLRGDKTSRIMDHLLKLSGVAPGESSRSGRSSRSTPRH